MTTNEVISNLENKDFPSSISSSKKVTAAAEQRTIECIVDSLTVRLAEVKETINNNGKEIHVRKYYRQARELSKWIPIAKPSPAFIIYISDLTPQLKAQ